MPNAPTFQSLELSFDSCFPQLNLLMNTTISWPSKVKPPQTDRISSQNKTLPFTHSQKRKNMCFLPCRPSPPLHIPLMHHLTSACTAAACTCNAGLSPCWWWWCVCSCTSSAVIWIDSSAGKVASGLCESIRWLDLAASVLVRKDVTKGD
jgi:hypothetical protein